MTNIVRAAMTQTINVADIPADISQLDARCIEKIRSENVAYNIGLIKDAARNGAKIVCLNELFTAPYFAIGDGFEKQWTGFAEVASDSRTVAELCELTKELSITVLAPIYEKMPNGGMKYNTAFVIEKGQVIGKYRKMHVPHGRNEKGNFTEGYYYSYNDDQDQNRGMDKVSGHPFFPVFDTQVGKVGLVICFDRHFEYVWEYLDQAGVQMVFSPAVTYGNTSEAAWLHEFPTEAVRHGIFVGGSNKKGREFDGGPEFFGKSYFVGPDGVRLSDISSNPELVIADLDLDKLQVDPSGWNLRANRRDFGSF